MHGEQWAKDAEWATEYLFAKDAEYTEDEVAALKRILLYGGAWSEGDSLLDVLVKFELVSSKNEARKLVKSGAISFNGKKVLDEGFVPERSGVLKRGKNKFAVVG